MSSLARSPRRLQIGALLAGLIAAIIAFIALRAGYAQVVFLLLASILVASSVGYLLWRANPAYTISAGFVLSCFSGHWADAGSPVGGVIAPDRLLLAGGLVAIALRGPWMRKRPPIKVEAVHYILLTAWLYVVGSALLAGTFFEQTAFFKLAEAFGAGPFLVFLLAPYTFTEPKQRDALLAGLVTFGAYLGAVAVLEVAGAGALVLPKYINNPNIGIHYGRARGPFAEAVSNGTGLYLCAVGAAVAAYVWRERGRIRLIAAAVSALCFVDTFITFQRSVWLATVIATLVTLVAVRPLRRFLVPVVLISALVVSSLLLVSPTVRRKASERTNDIGTVHDRDNLNRAAINMIKTRPLGGFGWDEFTARSTPYFDQNFNFQLTASHSEVHNLYLSYSAELGLIGTALWAFALLAGVGGALSTRGPPELEPWRAGLVAVATFYLVVSAFVPPQVFPNLMLWLWVAVVWSSRVKTRIGPTVALAAGAPPPTVEAAEAPTAPFAPAPLAGPDPEPEEKPTPEEEPAVAPAAPRELTGEAARAAALAEGLAARARSEDWLGADPYDGLWQARWPGLVTGRARGRQAIIQLGARSPVNLRALTRSGHPLIAKAPALFGAAATRLWLVTGRPEHEGLARDALETVDGLSSSSPDAWGYPFPVQTRWSFYDADTPNVVVTAFCALALHEAAAAWEMPAWGERARRAAEWALAELWIPDEGFFAYHPESRELVHNANLLGARLVWRVLGDEPRTRAVVARAVQTTLGAQRPDGAFPYGQGESLSWADSFHTGYVLDCLADLRAVEEGVGPALESGARFWTTQFFGQHGEPRLWPGDPFPLDGHSAGTALTTLAALERAGLSYGDLPERVARNVRVDGMRDGHGVHRRWRTGRSRVVYPRWVDAHLALGLASFSAQAVR